MDEGGIATTHIMRVSGHKSKESVKHYVRRLSDKKKREISDCLNDTLTNSCGQKFAKTTLPSNTENMLNVGSNENNSSDINTTDVKIFLPILIYKHCLTMILNCKMYPLQMFQVTPFRVFSLCQYNSTASWRIITEM